MKRPGTSQRHWRGGFTLFEVLVSIGILSLVTTLGTGAYLGMTRAWYDTRTLTEMNAAANNALDAIAEDISTILSPSLSNTPLRGIDGTTQDTRFLHMTFADDHLLLPVLVEGGGNGPLTVMYRVNRGDANKLSRTVGALGDEFPQGARIDVINRYEVIDFRVEYAAHHAAGWAPNWTVAGLPRAIRVSMTLMHPSQRHLQIARYSVFEVPVQ